MPSAIVEDRTGAVSTLKIGWDAAKANRLPMLVLWLFAAVTVVGYYTVPCVAAAFGPLTELQLEYGWISAFWTLMCLRLGRIGGS